MASISSQKKAEVMIYGYNGEMFSSEPATGNACPEAGFFPDQVWVPFGDPRYPIFKHFLADIIKSIGI